MVFFTMCIVATTTDICIKGVVTIASQSRVALIIHYDGNGRNGIDHGHGCIGYHRSQSISFSISPTIVIATMSPSVTIPHHAADYNHCCHAAAVQRCSSLSQKVDHPYLIVHGSLKASAGPLEHRGSVKELVSWCIEDSGSVSKMPSKSHGSRPRSNRRVPCIKSGVRLRHRRGVCLVPR